jgi:hypothetical protein
LIATVAREIVHELDPGVGRSGPHAFAARIAPLVGRANASIASRTTFRDDRDTPSSSGAERRNHTTDPISEKAKYFSSRLLTRIREPDPSGKSLYPGQRLPAPEML